MSLEILGILVVAGIGGIAVLLHLLGLSNGRRFDGKDDARAAWLREFPDRDATDILLSDDARAALIRGPDGLGVTWCFGADTVARPLVDYDIVSKTDGIQIVFHDIAAPRATIRLSPTAVTRWQEWMRPE
ncbi:hypothetical protein [Shimia biformata]|uniref:hypothetical protein n=1 Tax=Shimia biformata TaxID=1294299 RepID=UPI001951829B|nr:hypothetical protein [Shimia biformata]